MLPNVTRVYIDHGALEDIVPTWNAIEMEARLKAQGVHVDLLMYAGFAHDLSQSQDWHRRQSGIYETFLGR
jgi:dipeptidyl aminopeptidase/acylaminoacyl peptidase